MSGVRTVGTVTTAPVRGSLSQEEGSSRAHGPGALKQKTGQRAACGPSGEASALKDFEKEDLCWGEAERSKRKRPNFKA